MSQMPTSPSSLVRLMGGVLLLVLCVGCESVPLEDGVSAVPGERPEVFVHKASGMAFPKHVGGFERSSVADGAADKPLVSVDYRATNTIGEGRMNLYLNAHVRVGLSGGLTPEAVLKKDQEACLRRNTGAKVEDSKSGDSGYTYITYPRPAWHDVAGVETYVRRHGDHLVIYSFTFLALRYDDMRGPIDQFMKTLNAQ